MKLLLVSVKSDVTRGGIAVWTEQFLSQCVTLGIDCHLVNTEITGKRTTTGKRSLFDEFTRTRRIFRDLKNAFTEENFDAAHLNTSCGTFGLLRDYFVAQRIKRHGIPLVVQYHCELPYWVRRRISRFFLKRLALLGDKNAVLCKNSERFLSKKMGIPSVKIPNFIHHSLIRTTPKEINATIKHIFFVGRVEAAKGIQELYTVAKLMPHITFELLGSISPSAASLGTPPNVQLLGSLPRESVLEHLDRADLLLLPSHTEGCSVAILESLARGVPVIATDVGANAEVLSGGCGIVVPKHDVEAMIAAIEFLDNPKKRAEISACAVQKAQCEYTEENVAKLLDLFEEK